MNHRFGSIDHASGVHAFGWYMVAIGLHTIYFIAGPGGAFERQLSAGPLARVNPDSTRLALHPL